jgi:hypothetical protein
VGLGGLVDHELESGDTRTWKVTQKPKKQMGKVGDSATHRCPVYLASLLRLAEEFIPVELSCSRVVFLLGVVGRAVVLAKERARVGISSDLQSSVSYAVTCMN